MPTDMPSASRRAPLPLAPGTVQGILCVEIGMLFFVGQDALMKVLLSSYPIWMLLFARSLISVAVLVPLILWLGGPHRLLTPLWPVHMLRGGLFAAGFALFYAAFPFMGLAEVSTIFFSAPLIVAVLAALWLREQIGRHRIAALGAGFAGVVIAINPTTQGLSWVSVLPLGCAMFYAVGQVLARKIGDRETSLTLGLHTLLFAGIFILPLGGLVNLLLPEVATHPHLAMRLPATISVDWPMIALLGLAGMLGYIFLSRAYQVASASLVAPFDYSYLPIATLLGYLVWNEVPPVATLWGMGLVVGSGLYLGYRELRATRHSADPALVGESVFPPTAVPLTQIHADENDVT
ncbi:DMT family transporter [Roseovarius sp. B08]|uniref:DMT family transporter n=1 Tax=Roseovarius sp. B08 TaxID=3449223 RepID=UPI003EDC570E